MKKKDTLVVKITKQKQKLITEGVQPIKIVLNRTKKTQRELFSRHYLYMYIRKEKYSLLDSVLVKYLSLTLSNTMKVSQTTALPISCTITDIKE